MKKLLSLTILVGMLVIGFYYYFQEVGRTRVTPNEIFVTSAEIPGAFDGVRIVQISDIMIRQESCLQLLDNMVTSINDNLAPEIIFFTGNLFLPDGLEFQQEATDILAQLNANLVKLAVLGYHDLAHENQTIRALQSAGFRILDNNSTEIFNQSPFGINVIGAHPANDRDSMNQLLNDHVMSNRANLLLSSTPTFATLAFNHPVLMQFSGHCLATQDSVNQNAPCFQFYSGTYHFADRFTLHVSAGLARFQTPQNLLRLPSIDSFLLISLDE